MRATRPLRWLATLPLLCGLGCATVPDTEGWIEVRTEAFELVSRLPEAETRELADRLELFRRAVTRFTDIPPVPDEQRIRVYAFDEKGFFGRFIEAENAAGFYRPQMRGDVIALVSAYHLDAEEIIFHEYTHRLIHGTRRVVFPKWFDEGFAELMGAFELKNGSVRIGELTSRAMLGGWERWMPLSRIVDASGFERMPADAQSMFYAQSWLMAHYMMFGPGEAEFSERMGQFLALRETGLDERTAFEQAFGEIDALETRLQRYLRAQIRAISIPTENFGDLPSPSVRRLSRAEAAEALGSLAITGGRPHYDLAQAYFEEALAAAPDRPRSLCGLADLHKFRGDWKTSESLFERAIELAPDDALTQLDYGQYWYDLGIAQEDPAQRAAMLERARSHLVASYRLDPNLAETYAFYGMTYLHEGEDASKGVDTLAYASSLLPSNTSILFALGRAYRATGRTDEADFLLRKVVTWSHDPGLAARARELLEGGGADAPAPVGAP